MADIRKLFYRFHHLADDHAVRAIFAFPGSSTHVAELHLASDLCLTPLPGFHFLSLPTHASAPSQHDRRNNPTIGYHCPHCCTFSDANKRYFPSSSRILSLLEVFTRQRTLLTRWFRWLQMGNPTSSKLVEFPHQQCKTRCHAKRDTTNLASPW